MTNASLDYIDSLMLFLSCLLSPFLFGCALETCQAVVPSSEALSHSKDPDHAPHSFYNECDIYELCIITFEIAIFCKNE